MALLLSTGRGFAQESSAPVPQADVTVVTPDGVAHVARIVPAPATVSPEAQRMLSHAASDLITHKSLQQRRTETDVWQSRAGQAFKAIYPVTVQQSTIAGVPVRIITPPDVPADHQSRVLINLHGGGFNSDSGSLTESIPVAALSRMEVVAVLYRLAPEHPFPAAVDDAIAVYRDLLKTHSPENIGIFGTSAGADSDGRGGRKSSPLKSASPGCVGHLLGKRRPEQYRRLRSAL